MDDDGDAHKQAWKSCMICLEEMADENLRKHTCCSCLLCQSCIEVGFFFFHFIYFFIFLASGFCGNGRTAAKSLVFRKDSRKRANDGQVAGFP